MSTQTTESGFARCGSCRRPWVSWQDFLFDPQVRMLGFQGSIRWPDTNLLVFEHSCGSSVSVLTHRLRHLLPAPVEDGLPSLRGTDECPGHCLSLADLAACDRPCVNARDRDLIRVIGEMRQGQRGHGG
jgi:hypothetical protein